MRHDGGHPRHGGGQCWKRRAAAVYGEAGAPEACGEPVDRRARCRTYIDVDLRGALLPDRHLRLRATCCSVRFTARIACRRRRRCAASASTTSRGCFFGRGDFVPGAASRAAGCGARCTSLGRPCNGCAGLSPDANVAAARAVCAESGVSVAAFDEALQMFNYVNPALSEASEE